ncbi:MAG TPA: nitrite reductase (NAD(P)H) small subunit [Ignavibacteriaceae bacterium]|nr:nitrite reductase (NAD(P)H) small subunit [Ignavibacteriaceae bacterium]
MEGFQKVCRISDLINNSGRRFMVDDVDIAIFKVDDNVYALSNICPHQHSPLIYDGFLEDGCVVCPAHGWIFNLQTGKTPTGQRGLNYFDVRIVEENVFVKVYKKLLNW